MDGQHQLSLGSYPFLGDVSVLQPIGKAKIIDPGQYVKKMDLWGTYSEQRGRLRVQDMRKAFNWDTVEYLDNEGFEIKISAHDHGPFAGFSTDTFMPDTVLVVCGRKEDAAQGCKEAWLKLMGGQHLATVPLGSSTLQEHEKFARLMVLFDEARQNLSEMGEKLECLSKVLIQMEKS